MDAITQPLQLAIVTPEQALPTNPATGSLTSRTLRKPSQDAPAPAWVGSEIDHDVASGLGTADQHIAVGRRLDRLGPIADSAENEPRLAAVANAGPARPTHGHVAGLGEIEDALEC